MHIEETTKRTNHMDEFDQNSCSGVTYKDFSMFFMWILEKNMYRLGYLLDLLKTFSITVDLFYTYLTIFRQAVSVYA